MHCAVIGVFLTAVCMSSLSDACFVYHCEHTYEHTYCSYVILQELCCLCWKARKCTVPTLCEDSK